MFNGKRKHEVSDPAFYDSLITEQKKRARQHSQDAGEWLELGRLYEAKIDMILYFARRQFIFRYFLPIFALCILGTIGSYHFFAPQLMVNSWLFALTFAIYSFAAFVLIYLWFSRYPPSGGKYFKKAIQMDPQCGDAYMYLGLIALRRYQKRTACRLLEHALKLDVSNKNKIEQMLKFIYETEFMSFFKERSEKEIRMQGIIDHQRDQIRQLRSKNANLEKRVESLSAKVDEAKWKISRKAKQLDKEMKHHVSSIHKDYEKKIAALQEEAKAEAQELAQRDFIRLTTEILESKAGLEEQSFTAASKATENIVGKRSWQAFSEHTRLYLATAEQVYTVLAEQEEKPDYSLVGMELCKALETEINQRLVSPFIAYLNGNMSDFLKIHQTGETKDGPSYFTYLAKVVDQENYPEVTSLTLGQYLFILNLTLQDDYALKEYSDFLDWICAASGAVFGKTFLSKLETAVKQYRNTIAHQAPMNKNEYDHLRELIFSGNGSLLTTCCKIESNNHSKKVKGNRLMPNRK
jgi:TolA-binding protein